MDDYAYVEGALNSISPDIPRAKWIAVMGAVKTGFGEEGKAMVEEWSKGGSSYDQKSFNSDWKHLTIGKVPLKTVYKEARAHGWVPDRDEPILTQSEQTARQERLANEKKIQDSANAKDADKAQWLLKVRYLENNQYPSAEHPYLSKKMIDPTNADMRINQGWLQVPIRDMDGNLKGIQGISPEGIKGNIKGLPIAGGFHVIGDIEKSKSIAFAEGYATANSINKATGMATVVTFSIGNMGHVVDKFQERYPEHGKILVADTDLEKGKNEPLKFAQNIAAKIGSKATVISPQFTDSEIADFKASNNNKLPSDYNDLEAIGRLDKAKADINQARKTLAEQNNIQPKNEVKTMQNTNEAENGYDPIELERREWESKRHYNIDNNAANSPNLNAAGSSAAINTKPKESQEALSTGQTAPNAEVLVTDTNNKRNTEIKATAQVNDAPDMPPPPSDADLMQYMDYSSPEESQELPPPVQSKTANRQFSQTENITQTTTQTSLQPQVNAIMRDDAPEQELDTKTAKANLRSDANQAIETAVKENERHEQRGLGEPIDSPAEANSKRDELRMSPEMNRELANAEKQLDNQAQESKKANSTLAIPSQLNNDYLVSGDKREYFNRQSNALEFAVVNDKTMKTSNNNPNNIRSMLNIAKENKWTSIKVTGSKDFRKETWMQANIMGIKAKGYNPTKEDVKIMEARKAEFQKNQPVTAQTPNNTIENISRQPITDKIKHQVAAATLATAVTTSSPKPSAESNASKVIEQNIRTNLQKKAEISPEVKAAVMSGYTQRATQLMDENYKVKVMVYDPKGQVQKPVVQAASPKSTEQDKSR